MLDLPKSNIIEGTWESVILNLKKDSKNERWIYRGILEDWPLRTTLERCCDMYQARLFEIESRTIREFQRKFNHIAPDINIPEYADTIWWLSIMQHHGAPTRLLDWTYSPFIAAYFALENKFSELANASNDNERRNKGNGNRSTVWAIRQEWLYERGEAFIKQKREFEKIKNSEFRSLDGFFSSEEQKPFVHQANSFSLNQRLSIQQGVFLFATDLTRTFEANLREMKGWNSNSPANIKKYVIENNSLSEALGELFTMNVSRTSLFPGLDGFAQSLFTKACLIQPSGGSPR